MRHRAEHTDRSERLGRGILPAVLAIVIVVAVMWVWSPFAPEIETSTTAGGPASAGGPATTVATVSTSVPVSTSAPSPSGSALLVITQDGRAVVVALFVGGPKGGVVLVMPGITLLRSGDRFVELSQAYSADAPASLAAPVAEALAVPSAAVAAAAGDATLPERLDAQGADAGAVSAVLAASLAKAPAGGGAGGWWAQAALQGEAGAFRASLEAAVTSTAGKVWMGQAITGFVAAYDTGGSYLEPDLQAAKAALAGTGAGS